MADKTDNVCQWVSLAQALQSFACPTRVTQTSDHIRPLHWYVACRLCLEGGIPPDHITPRPPFTAKGKGHVLEFDPLRGGTGEQTVLGGLKTKRVDVVVSVDGIGPVIAISLKGTLNAVRNLTNRMEEAGGDCTNLHMNYPSLVYAFWHLLRGNRAGKLPANAPKLLRARKPKDLTPPDECRKEDVVIGADGKVTDHVVRYHNALLGLAGRTDLRNQISRYEAVALTIASADDESVGAAFDAYPLPASELRFERLFDTVYRHYDLRFVYQAPDFAAKTTRRMWAPESPVATDWPHAEYAFRTGEDGPESPDGAGEPA